MNGIRFLSYNIPYICLDWTHLHYRYLPLHCIYLLSSLTLPSWLTLAKQKRRKYNIINFHHLSLASPPIPSNHVIAVKVFELFCLQMTRDEIQMKIVRSSLRATDGMCKFYTEQHFYSLPKWAIYTRYNKLPGRHVYLFKNQFGKLMCRSFSRGISACISVQIFGQKSEQKPRINLK